MAIDGTYSIEIDTPMGKQSAMLTLKANGSALGGTMEGPMGSSEFSGGMVNGDEIAWSMEINTPMGKINLEYRGKVTGDEISGEVKAGDFGSSPFKGARA